MSNEIKITGFDELTNKIKKLGNDKDKRKEVLSILRQVAKPTLEASRQTVPVSKSRHFSRGKFILPGNLKKSLGLITATKSENPTIVVGARAKGKFDGWYAHFVSEGHEYVAGNGESNFVFSARQFRNTSVRNKRSEEKKQRKNKRHSKSTKAALRKTGRIKMTKPNKFLRRAYEATQSAVTLDAERKFEKFIQRRINRLSK